VIVADGKAKRCERPLNARCIIVSFRVLRRGRRRRARISKPTFKDILGFGEKQRRTSRVQANPKSFNTVIIGDRLVVPNLFAGQEDFSLTVVIRLQPQGAKLCNTFRDRCYTRYTLGYGLCWRSVQELRRERNAGIPDGRSPKSFLLLQRTVSERIAAR